MGGVERRAVKKRCGFAAKKTAGTAHRLMSVMGVQKAVEREKINPLRGIYNN